MSIFTNTICAPASSGGGAISVIRVSGDKAIEIVDRIFSPAVAPEHTGMRPVSLMEAKGYSMHFGSIYAGDGEERRQIDEVIVSVFRAPASYTGENSVEISCHGSSYIVQEILDLLIQGGAKMAAPGEFTQRAFVNGKMDLSQAEAVADLIASQTEAAHRIAMNQLKGGFSDELSEMRQELLHIVSLMELELDFSEEEVEFADRRELRELLDKVTNHIGRLISSFSLGNAIKNGVPVAIAGATNSGKSTLLNAILGENRAIVSDIAGTTRDTIEETFNIDGVLFRFIDTAGLRNSDDIIERIGIERAYSKIDEALLVLAVCDLTSPLEDIISSARDILGRIDGDSPGGGAGDKKVVFLLNKSDIASEEQKCEAVRSLESLLKDCRGLQLRDNSGSCTGSPCPIFCISAKEKIGIREFIDHISSAYRTLNASSETSLVTNVRHLEALKAAQESLLRVREGLDTTTPTDLIAQDIREALYHLGTIVGEITTDEVLGNIFRNFCIGK